MIDRDGGLNLLVFDYGGGTLDVSVTNLSRVDDGSAGLRILTNMGNNRLGGDSLDLLVMKELVTDCKARFAEFDASLICTPFSKLEDRKKKEGWSTSAWTSILFARTRWKDAAEAVKIELSGHTEAMVEIPPEAIMHLEDNEVGIASEAFVAAMELHRFEELLKPTIEKSEELVRAALGLAELGPGDIDFVLHSGRQSLMPAVRQRIRQIFPELPENRDVLDERHLKVCVARGAALYGLLRNRPAEAGSGVKLINEGRRLPHGYGIDKLTGTFTREYEEIIPKGFTYPDTIDLKIGRDKFPPAGPLRLKFYQNSGKGRRLEDNPEIRLVGQVTVNPMEEEESECSISFHIDVNRSLKVHVDGKPVEVKSLRHSDEEDWLG
jgi:molecular chaperone DnaK (HSP70)